MKSKVLGSFEKAKEYAFLLFKFRLRSENELRFRLKQKKFEEAIISRLIDFLKEKKFLDDSAFSRIWIESRLKKPFGLRRIRQELSQKGVEEGIVEDQVNLIKENYSEKQIVESVIRNKLNKNKDEDLQKTKRRIYAYLLRQGFSPEVVIDKLNERLPSS